MKRFFKVSSVACFVFMFLGMGSIHAVESPICETTNGKCYYISNKQGSGSGTFEDPFGMDDLPKSDIKYCGLSCPACEILQPGDILYFREGRYELLTCPGDGNYYIGYLRTKQSGLPDAPISFKAYPGESVQLIKKNEGSQPILGNCGSDYIVYKGFTLFPNAATGARISGIGVELSHCEIIGQYVATADNHDGIRIQAAENSWIHHNKIYGVTGLSGNSAGIKLYRTKNIIIEDNYIYQNTAGISDKESGINNTYRRNYLNENIDSFYGNNQGNISTIFIYDNVIAGRLELHCLTENAEVHDNLILYNYLTGAWAGATWNTKLWNNIVISKSDKIVAYREPQNAFVNTGDKRHLAYMDYNLYDATPEYRFGEYAPQHTFRPFNISEMQSMGFENNSVAVNSVNDVFVDEASYELLPRWKNSGRYGDAFGPENIKEVLDISRYGTTAKDVKPNGYLAYYPFTGNADDQSGNSKHASVNGATLTTDRFGTPGSAYDFDGSASYIATPIEINPSALPAITMSAWVYPRKTGEGSQQNRRQILSHDDGGFDRSMLMENSQWSAFTGIGCWNTGAAVDLNTWQHIAVVYDTSNIRFYKNGVEYSYGSAPQNGSSVNKLRIGDNPGEWNEFFDGIIDDVRISGRALSHTEIMNIYENNQYVSCIHTDDDLLFYMCAEYYGKKYRFEMNYEPMPFIPDGHYWKMDAATFTETAEGDCIPVVDDLTFDMCAEYQGVPYYFTLDYSPRTDVPEGEFYWKMDVSTLRTAP